MTLWTSHDAAAATGGRATRDFSVAGVSIDTRTIRPGDLFVALQAARDGHDFVAQALEKGQANHCLSFMGEPLQQAQVLYALWLGANLQAKMSRSATPLENALAHVKTIIAAPAV